MEFSLDQLEGLKNLIGQEEEETDGHVYGSALNPGSLHGGKDKKEIAKPNAKVEVKTLNRDAKGGATAESIS